MRSELVRKAADLTAAHRVGLAGQRERRSSDLADAPRGEMAIEDGVDLVGALRRLVDPLRIKRDHARRRAKHPEELCDVALAESGCERCRRSAAGNASCARQHLVKARGVTFDIIGIERAVLGEMHEQPRKQRGVGAGPHAQEQFSVLGRIGAARIDHDQACAARLLVDHHALEQHRMAPGRVGAHQHEQVGLVEIFIAAGHGVGAKGAAVAGDSGGHAQARIGVDIGRADEPLHELVGDVIVLGQQLAGEIERHRVCAIAGDDVLQAMSDMIERIAPGDTLQHALATDHRMEQPALERERLAKRGALRAKSSEIGGMLAIA
jgi:hypothetical protein